MRILIIEDDANKYTQIKELISAQPMDYDIVITRSYQSGLKEIFESDYDLIILDMSLPTFDITQQEQGGPFRTYAGEEILTEMRRKNVTTETIVITQFESFGEGEDSITLEQLKTRLKDKFPRIYSGTIYYNAAESNWKNELINYLRNR